MWFDRDAAEPTWSLPEVRELETGDYYPLHPHSRMLNRVKVHPQMIVENAADPYHIAPVHHGDRPAETTSFYWFTMACVREEGDTGDVPTGRAARWIELQQEIIKQDFFTWENMQYLEKPSFAVEEAKNYASLRRWCRRFYPEDTFAEPVPSGSK